VCPVKPYLGATGNAGVPGQTHHGGLVANADALLGGDQSLHAVPPMIGGHVGTGAPGNPNPAILGAPHGGVVAGVEWEGLVVEAGMGKHSIGLALHNVHGNDASWADMTHILEEAGKG
jgi:hypothetical protein